MLAADPCAVVFYAALRGGVGSDTCFGEEVDLSLLFVNFNFKKIRNHELFF